MIKQEIKKIKEKYDKKLEESIFRYKHLSLRKIASIVGVSHQQVKRVKDKDRHDKNGHKKVVYFIQDNFSKRIKIGKTINMYDRFLRLKSQSPINDMSILLTIDGYQRKETFLHRKFKQYNHHGEWFEPSQEILDYIKEENLSLSIQN